MYEYIKGPIVSLNPTDAVIEASGIGYRILISLQTYTALRPIMESGHQAQVFLYYYIREDAAAFYGFASPAERALFEQLIAVSGIGPNTARMILSAMSTDEFRNAILTEDLNRIKGIKGIGLKTAQRMIVDLKDKMLKIPGDTPVAGLGQTTVVSRTQEEAAGALVMLGFAKPAVEKVLKALCTENPDLSLEALIKAALKRL